MGTEYFPSPEEFEALKAALATERGQRLAEAARAAQAEAELAVAKAKAAEDQVLIAHQQLQIAKLRRELHGPRAERTARLIEQMELQFEELAASATEDELAAERAVAKTTNVAAFTRKWPARQPFPDHLPRERVVEPAPTACPCCGSERLRKLGEDITETLEVIPRQWKVIQHVREKFTCRDCEKISQAPAPFHVTPRGWAGPSLLCATTDRSAVLHRRRRCFTTRATAVARIRKLTLSGGAGSCRPTPMAATSSSIDRSGLRARSSRRPAGRIAGANSLSLPTSKRPPGARPRARRLR